MSELWTKASLAMADLDPPLANVCFIKGQGWLDPKVWEDPRYKRFRTGIKDMIDALVRFNENHHSASTQAVGGARSACSAEKLRILFVSANPPGTSLLELDEEVREIEAKIRAGDCRDSMEFVSRWAARPDDPTPISQPV